MKIKSLYEKYEIMPQLVTHQLRVAGVAKLITEKWVKRELAEQAVKACLLHDMGNIVKFDLTEEGQEKLKFKESIDLAHWRKVQQKYWDKYGKNANKVTYSILQKEKLEPYIEILNREAQLFKMKPRREDFLMAGKPAIVLTYADLRVAPAGVIPMQERIQDLAARYGGDRAESQWAGSLEKYVQELSEIPVTEITEAAVKPFFSELLAYEI